MNTNFDNMLDRIRPRDRERVNGLLRDLVDSRAHERPGHVTVSRVGGGGEETQVGRWEPADSVGLTDWLRSVVDGQATDASPATAKVRIRSWHSGGKAGPSATVVLEPFQPALGKAIAALPGPAGEVESQPPAVRSSGAAPVVDVPARCDQAVQPERIATLELRLAVALDGRHWYEEAHRGARATIMELERELRQAHATLAQALADRAALQRDRESADRRIDRRDVRIRELEREVAKVARERDEAIAERDEVAAERDDLEEVTEEAMEELRKRLGIPADED